MVLIEFACLDSQGNYRECSFVGQGIEDCFDALSVLAGAGWRPIWVKLIETATRSLHLPVEAFDGLLMREPLRKLQQEWETILYQH